jgi:DNA-binding transcriptional ArsR family regulator
MIYRVDDLSRQCFIAYHFIQYSPPRHNCGDAIYRVNSTNHFAYSFFIVILQYSYTKMGASKSEHFSDRHNHLALLAKALAHPARIAIIDFLIKKETCICGDIVNELPLSQPTISQHLKELKDAGLIKGSIEGNSICYCIEPKTLSKLTHYLNQIITKVNDQKTCC